MPTPPEVREQLADILASVVEADPSDVRDEAVLKDLGVDSLALVEVGDELGRRFGVYLTDETVDSLVTVGDAVKAVTQHDGSPARGAARTPDAMTTIMAAPPAAPRDSEPSCSVTALTASATVTSASTVSSDR
ncbi:MAG: acyl carrier protein [Actinomycetales bacterium]|nr:MAG: acyl carrier protein [Actinomycetales bacterium]